MGSKIIFGILLFLFFIGIINAIEISGLYYIVKKNTKCGFNVSEHLNASSAIQCATECSKRRGCFGVNFKRPQCDILNNDSDNEDSVNVQDWRCIRMYLYMFWKYLYLCLKTLHKDFTIAFVKITVYLANNQKKHTSHNILIDVK